MQEIGEDGAKVKKVDTYPIVVWTTKRQLLIFKDLMESEDEKLAMFVFDGTGRYDCGGGIVLNLGVVISEWDGNVITRRCYNVMHVWSQTENMDATNLGGAHLETALNKYYEMSRIIPKVTCNDASKGIIAGIQKRNWNCVMTSCYPHIKRYVKKNKNNAIKGNGAVEVVLADLDFLYKRAITDRMMLLLLPLVIRAWEDMGETKFARSFQGSHGKDPYYRFFIYATGVPSIITTQNYQEGSHNAQRFLVKKSELYAKAAAFLVKTMPRISSECPDLPPSNDRMTGGREMGLGAHARDVKWLQEAVELSSNAWYTVTSNVRSIAGGSRPISERIFLSRNPKKKSISDADVARFMQLVDGDAKGVPKLRQSKSVKGAHGRRPRRIVEFLREFLSEMAVIEIEIADGDDQTPWLEKKGLRIICYCPDFWKSGRGCKCSFACAARKGYLTKNLLPQQLLASIRGGRRRSGARRKLQGDAMPCYTVFDNENWNMRDVSVVQKMETNKRFLRQHKGTHLHGWAVAKVVEIKEQDGSPSVGMRLSCTIGRIIERVKLQSNGKEKETQTTKVRKRKSTEFRWKIIFEDEGVTSVEHWDIDRISFGITYATDLKCDGPVDEVDKAKGPSAIDETHGRLRRFLDTCSTVREHEIRWGSGISKAESYISAGHLRVYRWKVAVIRQEGSDVLACSFGTVTGCELDEGTEGDDHQMWRVYFQSTNDLCVMSKNDLARGLATWCYISAGILSMGMSVILRHIGALTYLHRGNTIKVILNC